MRKLFLQFLLVLLVNLGAYFVGLFGWIFGALIGQLASAIGFVLFGVLENFYPPQHLPHDWGQGIFVPIFLFILLLLGSPFLFFIMTPLIRGTTVGEFFKKKDWDLLDEMCSGFISGFITSLILGIIVIIAMILSWYL